MTERDHFRAERQNLNEKVMALDSLTIKRLYSLDQHTYAPGALDERTKELMGLACSMVLRCDDCVRYHIDRALQVGASPKQVVESFEIALLIGGSIVIPHLRRATAFLEDCLQAPQEAPTAP